MTTGRRQIVALVLLTAILAACSGPEQRGDGLETPSPASVPALTAISALTPPAAGTATGGVSAATPTGAPPDASATPGATAPVSASETPGQPATASATVTIPPAPTTVFDPASVSMTLEPVGSGFIHPVFLTHAGDGSGRIFVAEKPGRVRLLDGTPFLDISDRVLSPEVPSHDQEMGLIGVAFHPRFEENGWLYLHYIDLAQDHVISRFTASGGSADPASEVVLLTQDQPETNFNGGMLAFGPDGYLYIGFGTGGQSLYLHEFSQDLGSWLGKILRIDVDGGQPYAIPAGNPFVNVSGARAEIWAIGLRNPYRFAFDRATGELYIGSPGQFQREWVNLQPAGSTGGENYGWPMFEGSQCWTDWPGACDPTGVSMPIYERPTYGDGNCALIGGFVYRGSASPALQGAYLMSDYCGARVWALARDAAGAWVASEHAQLPGVLISSFGEDEAGELYLLGISDGVVYRIAG